MNGRTGGYKIGLGSRSRHKNRSCTLDCECEPISWTLGTAPAGAAFESEELAVKEEADEIAIDSRGAEPRQNAVATDVEADMDAWTSARVLAIFTAICAASPPRTLSAAPVAVTELAKTLPENVTLVLLRRAILLIAVLLANMELVGLASILMLSMKRLLVVLAGINSLSMEIAAEPGHIRVLLRMTFAGSITNN